MAQRLNVTQCTVPCDKLSTLKIRLTDPTLTIDNRRFLDINLISQDTNCCTGQTTYIIEYDETLLVDPGTFLTADDFDLICVDPGDDYAIEVALRAIP